MEWTLNTIDDSGEKVYLRVHVVRGVVGLVVSMERNGDVDVVLSLTDANALGEALIRAAQATGSRQE